MIEGKTTKFNVSEFLRTASSVAQGQIEGGLEAEQLQQQRQQQLAAQQFQQLQFLAGQEERARAGAERGIETGLAYAPQVQAGQARADFLTKGLGNYARIAGTPSSYGAQALRGLGEAGYQVPSPATFPSLLNPAGPGQGPPPAPPPPQQPPPTGGAPAGLQMPGTMAGVGPAPAPPAAGASAPPAVTAGPTAAPVAGAGLATPEMMNVIDQVVGNWPLSPGTRAIFRGMMAQQAARQVQPAVAGAVGAQAAASGGGTGTGPVGSGVPGHLPGAGLVPPASQPHPGGMITVPVTPPLATPTGPPNGVAPGQAAGVQPPGGVLDLFGIKSPLAEFDPQDIAAPWTNFQQLVRQLGQYNLKGKDLTDAQGIVARHVRRPRTAAELEELGKDYQGLLGIVSGKSIAERQEQIKEKAQWPKDVQLGSGAAFLQQEGEAWRREWGPNPLTTRPEYRTMVQRLAEGDTAGADRLAEQMQLSLRGGLKPADENARLGRFFQQIGKLPAGSLSGHELLALSQKYMPGMFTEADAPLMQRYLQGAAAEKQQQIALGQFKNWKSLPPQARDAVLASYNGMAKIVGDQPISVPADFVAELTADQRSRLFQMGQRLVLQGEAQQSLDAHRKIMEGLAQERNARGVRTGPDQMLADLIRKERTAIQQYQQAPVPAKTYEDALPKYSEWKRLNHDKAMVWNQGPQGAAGDYDIPKMRRLWDLDRAAEVAGQRVTDRIQELAKQQAAGPPGGGRTAPGGSTATAASAGGANQVMMRGPSGNLQDVTPILTEALRQRWTNERTQQYLKSQGYRP